MRNLTVICTWFTSHASTSSSDWISAVSRDRFCYLLSGDLNAVCARDTFTCSHDDRFSCSIATISSIERVYDRSRHIVLAAVDPNKRPMEFMRQIALPYSGYIWVNKIYDTANFQTSLDLLGDYIGHSMKATVALTTLYIDVPGAMWRIGSYSRAPTLSLRAPEKETEGDNLLGKATTFEFIENRTREKKLNIKAFVESPIVEPLRKVQSYAWTSQLFRMTDDEHMRFADFIRQSKNSMNHSLMLAENGVLKNSHADLDTALWLFNVAYIHAVALQPPAYLHERSYDIRMSTLDYIVASRLELLSTPNFFISGVEERLGGIELLLQEPSTIEELLEALAGFVSHGDMPLAYKCTILRQWQFIAFKLFGKGSGAHDVVLRMIPEKYQWSVRYLTPRREHVLETIAWTMSALISTPTGAARVEWFVTFLRVMKFLDIESMESERVLAASSRKLEMAMRVRLGKWSNFIDLVDHITAKFGRNNLNASVVDSVTMYVSVIGNIRRFNGQPQVVMLVQDALTRLDEYIRGIPRSLCHSFSCRF